MFQKITKDWVKRLGIMLLSVFLMGFALSLLVLTEFGTDPFSAMNYGISRLLGISFGTYQFTLNIVLLLLMIAFYRSVIGWGTVGNMVIVGYTADFFAYIWHHVCHIPGELSLEVRIIILIPALLLFVVAAAFYMQSGHGMSPYDAIPFIVDEVFCKRNGGKSHFKPIRLTQDLVCTLIAVVTGGEYGIITFLMVLTLAPVVQFVGELFEKRRKD